MPANPLPGRRRGSRCLTTRRIVIRTTLDASGGKLALVVFAVCLVGVLIGFYSWSLTYAGRLARLHGSGQDGQRTSGRRPEDQDRRRDRAEAQPEPRLGLLPRPHAERAGSARRSGTCRRTRPSTSRFYNFDGASGCATRSTECSASAGGATANQILLTGSRSTAIDPATPRTPSPCRHSGIIVAIPASPTTRRTSAATRPARWRPRTERSSSRSTRRRRATTAGSASSRAPRVDRRLRRADADDRLHGRLPQREGITGVSRRSRRTFRRPRPPLHRSGSSPSAIATPLVAIFLGPLFPPGNATVQATGQVFDNT